MTKQYGSDVVCPDSVNGIEGTHRPDNSGPFFCMCCGATDHVEA